jgi:sensitive to high expression protein 9
VKARRSAIDTAKQILETALTQQASAQKEVVALLERKHSWSNGDLERYMSLIRSEHVNDQAVNEAKEAVFEAESALEEARTRLEKRERAQYHEEQIWSDTIRRNSTWVTFGLMGVNIFLLLLSLLILEPWRRRRMVREIKSAMEAQKNAMEVAPLATTSSNDVSTTQNDLVKAAEIKATSTQAATSPAIPPPVHASPTATIEEAIPQEPILVGEPYPESKLNPTLDRVAPGAASLLPDELQVSSQEVIIVPEEVSRSDDISTQPDTWPGKAKAMAHDAFSERVISMRKIEFTAVILQSAAAGAVVAAAAIIAMLRPR